ncbi:uncharacterized protein BDZ99DRAFT_449141 [Mytilinidion resinicola]|uniref:Ubiquitin-like domain-containing protein n=1 Tax=Mytilinidion resinicola TaxID=574789 RepID=A0A6A6YEY1_9PEZI|nr:uncharacterized protein BDZ99DRAFT_449141 [Mytilinidion resinicola]KAF2806417.1 hypothetical protein BDZ99DRAFT_449141 [Mytilinidion resinicola]
MEIDGPAPNVPPNTGAEIQIIVKTRGRRIPIQTQSSATVEDIKICIQDKEGRYTQIPCLVFRGQRLEIGRTMSSYGVQQDSILHVVWIHPRFESITLPDGTEAEHQLEQ